MSSTRAVALEYYEAYGASDLDRWCAVLDEDVELWVDGETVRGRAAARVWAAEVWGMFPGIVVEPRIRIVHGGQVVSEVQYLNTGKEAHEWRLGGAACELLSVRDGCVRTVRNYYVPSPSDRTDSAPVLGRLDSHKLADEHVALRKVATLVAAGASDEGLFAAVTEGIGRIAAADLTALFGFGDDDTLVLLAAWTPQDADVPLGERRPLSPELRAVRDNGRPVRFDTLPEPAPFLDVAQSLGIRSSVGIPIRVAGRTWGVAFANSTRPEPLPPDTEQRLSRFAEFVAIALANAESRGLLRASRARVVATADATRRQLQRDVHDGAQQRLVQTVLALTMAREALGDREPEVGVLLAEALQQAERGTAALSDLVRGILPAALTRDGLRTGVASLTGPLTLPTDVRVDVPRLPAEAETTAYFIVAEALANVVEHAEASRAAVDIGLRGDTLMVVVSDDGRGGADPSRGTGLTGLLDRVDALEGSLRIDSPPGGGTRVEAALPLAATAPPASGAGPTTTGPR